MDEIEAYRERRKDPKDREARILLASALLKRARQLESGSQERLDLLTSGLLEDPYNFGVRSELAL